MSYAAPEDRRGSGAGNAAHRRIAHDLHTGHPPEALAGIGPKKRRHFKARRGDAARSGGLYPRRYEDRTQFPHDRGRTARRGRAHPYAVAAYEPRAQYVRSGLTPSRCASRTDTGALDVTYFNQPYRNLHRG